MLMIFKKHQIQAVNFFSNALYGLGWFLPTLFNALFTTCPLWKCASSCAVAAQWRASRLRPLYSRPHVTSHPIAGSVLHPQEQPWWWVFLYNSFNLHSVLNLHVFAVGFLRCELSRKCLSDAYLLSVPSFWQQEGLDDGPDFLSEEDRGVSFFFFFLVFFFPSCLPIPWALLKHSEIFILCSVHWVILGLAVSITSRSMSSSATG